MVYFNNKIKLIVLTGLNVANGKNRQRRESARGDKRKSSAPIVTIQKKRCVNKTPFLGIINNPDISHRTMIVGKAGSGKTTLLMKLLQDPRGWYKKYDKLIIICPTFKLQYEKVWSQIGSENVEVYLELTQQLLKDIETEQEQNGKTVLVIFDDIAQQLKHIEQKTVDSFVSTSRHTKINIVFLFQRFKQCPTDIRANIDCIIVFAAVSYVELNALHEMCAITTKKEFINMFRRVTQADYGFLTINTFAGGKMKFYKNFDQEIKFFSLKN